MNYDEIRMDGQPDPADVIVDDMEQHIHKLDHQQFEQVRRAVAAEEERRMEMVHGDILQRRRLVDKMLNGQVESVYYGSLTCRHIPEQGVVVVEDMDGLAQTVELAKFPKRDPSRIEAVQEYLDQMHLRCMAEL